MLYEECYGEVRVDMPLPSKERATTHENASDVAYQQLKEWIIDGPLEAGEAVRDVEIAQMLGVSRTPVREALIRLSQEGLVEFARGRGTRVAALRHERAPSLYRLGAELDGLAAELAAERLTDAEIERMRVTLAQLAVERDPARLRLLDEELHGVYHQASGNQPLVEMMAQVHSELRRLERVAFQDAQIRAEAHQEHSAIIDALAARDAARARKLASANWLNSWERIQVRLTRMLSVAGLESVTAQR